MKTEQVDQLLKCGEIIFTRFSKRLLYFCSYCCDDNLEKFSTETLLDFIQHISEYHFDKTLGRIDHQINILNESDLNPTARSTKYLEQRYYQDSSSNLRNSPNYQPAEFNEEEDTIISGNETSTEKAYENRYYQPTSNIADSWSSCTNNENTFEIHEENQHLAKQEIIEFEKGHIQSQSLISVEKPYKCEYCGKYFTQSQNLTLHKRIHTGEKPFVCEICSKAFAHKSNLNVHRKIHISNSVKYKIKKYKCSYCGKYFAQNQNLMIHIRTHTGEKPYNCDYCDKAFAHKSNLNVHLRMHTGKNPFSCKQCKEKFSNKPALVRHRKTHIAEESFKGNLNMHKRIHTGVKPYNCNICKKAFRHNSNLIVHRRIHNSCPLKLKGKKVL